MVHTEVGSLDGSASCGRLPWVTAHGNERRIDLYVLGEVEDKLSINKWLA